MAVVLGQLLALGNGLIELRRKARQVADKAHLNAILMEALAFALQYLGKELHQAINFVLRAFPILRRESKQSQMLDAQASSGLDRTRYRLSALAMAKEANLTQPLPIASVAIHDDSHMVRQRPQRGSTSFRSNRRGEISH